MACNRECLLSEAVTRDNTIVGLQGDFKETRLASIQGEGKRMQDALVV